MNWPSDGETCTCWYFHPPVITTGSREPCTAAMNFCFTVCASSWLNSSSESFSSRPDGWAPSSKNPLPKSSAFTPSVIARCDACSSDRPVIAPGGLNIVLWNVSAFFCTWPPNLISFVPSASRRTWTRALSTSSICVG